MTFSIADLALLAIAAFFILTGLYHGFIRTVGSLVGIIGGSVLASLALQWLSEPFNLTGHPVWTVFVFVLIVLLCSQIIGWIFLMLDRAYNLLSIVPFLSSINKLLGGLLGLLEGVAIVAAIGYVSQVYLSDGDLKTAILESVVMDWLSIAVSIMSWIILLVVPSS